MLDRLELSDKAAMWLEEERGISSEVAVRMNVASTPRSLVFQYTQNGEVLYHKHRVPKPEGGKSYYSEPKGVNVALLFNEDSLSEEFPADVPLIITEGELDAASFATVGAAAVVSVPNGAANRPGQGDIIPLQDKQFAYLWDGYKLKRNVDKFKTIILATDDDGPGLIMRDELAVRLGRERCYFVEYPDDCKDGNETLRRFGEDGLRDVIANAKPMVPDRLVSFSDIPPRSTYQSYTSGWSSLDKHFLIVPPELIVILGPANVGKSQWALNLVANLAREHALKGAILQFEDNPDRNRRDLMKYAFAWSKPGQVGRAITEPPHQWVDRMFKTISPAEQIEHDEDYTLDWLHRVIDEAVRRHDCRWVLIDPWNELEHALGRSETETDYTSKSLRHLKKVARKYQIAIIIVTHPPKFAAVNKTIEDMSLYDVSGSAAWKNKADHGIIVHRAGPTDPITHIKIDKSKDFLLMGVPGVVEMTFNPSTATFSSARGG